VPKDQAWVSVFDHGFTVGDGVFETCKVINGQVFALSRHLRRLSKSAEITDLPPINLANTRELVQELLEVDKALLPATARLRITFTAGAGPLGSDRSNAEPTLVCVWDSFTPPTQSATLVTSPWRRATGQATQGAKTTSYIENVLALKHAKAHGGTEALIFNESGRVCEGTGSNIFAVFSQSVATPPLADGCLAGITRELILEWFDATERSLTNADLLQADAVFLSSTTRDIQPVARFDDHHYDPVNSLVTNWQQEFQARAQQNLDP
jgi:branched-chain amino acid aminotransferase